MKKLFVLIALLWSVTLFALNINTASVKELTSLKGIGVKTAEKIVKYRSEHKFKSIEEIKNVKGIGQKKFDAIKAELEV